MSARHGEHATITAPVVPSPLFRRALALLALSACSSHAAPVPGPAPSAPTPALLPPPGAAPAPTAVPVAPASAAAPAQAPSSAPDAPSDPAITGEQAVEILFADAAERAARAAACPAAAGDAERIRCLLGARYAADPAAATIALELFARDGDVAGVDEDHLFDGGFRGELHLVPELPVGRYRRHLDWVAASAKAHDDFFAALAARGGKPPSEIRYRWRAIALRYFRSVGRTTPSAYAESGRLRGGGGRDWGVAYNVSGSLHGSASAVRETMFHEIFHLNDAAHGAWSSRALAPTFDRVVARCGTSMACLKPYAPNDTTVKGGTYYAFQPGNGVHEYAAELAIRYYREQLAALGLEPATSPGARGLPGVPFKCGPPENAVGWELLVGEFFAGIDLSPACPSDRARGSR